MELIDQHTKGIMEECKRRARDEGLQFDDESLEYIVSNRDLLDLSPKGMIPSLYEYWVHDVEVLKEYGKYKAYPSNPFETVINSRPAISFYNDNNPDWLNIMIFYHVIGHIDLFQNNVLFNKTWSDDFVGQALADKRLIDSLRTEYGRWVDYIIEFSRSIDNITGYFDRILADYMPQDMIPAEKLDFYFEVFLQEFEKKSVNDIFKEVQRYNQLYDDNPNVADSIFFSEIKKKYPEFDSKFARWTKERETQYVDLMEFIRENSPYLDRKENQWMKQVMSVIRNTALYFAPQIRSKILNEGWASYWHDHLFRKDDRIKGHEAAYSKINASVTSISRVGLNPYAVGLRLIEYVEELAEKGKLNFEFQKNFDREFRENYDMKTGQGKEAIFNLRKNFSDFMLIRTFTTQEFIDKHDLFVVGRRLNQQRGTWEYYVKSRNAEDYKNMLLDQLYHPPKIVVDNNKTDEKNLYIVHRFEGKQLIQKFIPDVLIGLEFLWGAQVQLETTEIVKRQQRRPDEKPQYDYRRVLYTMKDRKVNKKVL